MSSFFGLDVVLAGLGVVVFIVAESRRLRLQHRWLPIAGTCLIGVSFGLPLFLYQRQAHIDRTAV